MGKVGRAHLIGESDTHDAEAGAALGFAHKGMESTVLSFSWQDRP